MKTKTCSVCKKEKLKKEFNKNSVKKDGLQTCCRDCTNRSNRTYYASNKKKHKKAVTDRKHRVIEENKIKMFDYLSQCSCIDCGVNNPIVLDFDHLSNKHKCVSTMVNIGTSWNTIKKEIAKCEVRCSNCHRIKTAKENKYYKYLLFVKKS